MGKFDSIIHRDGYHLEIFAGGAPRKDGGYFPHFMVVSNGRAIEGLPRQWKASDIAFDTVEEAGEYAHHEANKWVAANCPSP